MKTGLMLVAALAAVVCLADAQAPRKLTPEQVKARMEARLRHFGGEIVRPDSYKGKVAIVNAQTRLPDADCAKVAAIFADATKCNIALQKDGAGAAVTLTVIDDPKEPKMLLAPEDHWGKVNVANLTDDLPTDEAKAKFFAPRARRLVMKALSLMIGGGASTFPGNVMNTATLRELDTLQETLPVDRIACYEKYLRALGVTPKVVVPYRRACHEGWAPAPTNDIQKAVWDKVHELPSKPMVIEPESKKRR